ncbi:MAG: PAS domain S-box protein, partial [Lachnospiraceae bacterium]|nr:PAS domain S-box protein [Lachnospiraceae bacterium]
MYHCHIHFYLAGGQHGIFEIIKNMSPLEHFTHEFYESGTPETSLAAGADAIFADLTGMDARETLQTLVSAKRKDASLILLADKDQTASLSDSFNEIDDIWVLPMANGELSFRFLRWQQAYKRSKDHWQDTQYLEAAINSVPNLVWYKDKDGVHEKVNDSFCRTVNKTRQQIEGRRHAYIWDVEQDDPACIESEHEVMSTRKTCIAEETVKTGDGTRLLTTYKSPLYDVDGSVMGTVGVAIDITQERAYEQELIKKNLTMERVFTSLDCGIMTHSLDGTHIISINRAALNILGYNTKKELMESGFDLMAPSVLEEDKQKLRESIMKLDKPNDTVNVEYRIQHDNGQILHIMGNIKLLEEDGTLFYQRFLLGCTDQKLKEKRERMESERRQMELVHALSVDFQLVWFFDLDTGMGNLLQLTDNSHYKFDYIFNEEISINAFMELFINKTVYESDKEILRNASSVDYIKKELSEKKFYYVNFRITKDDS